ncbi:MAG: hypothetical protein DBW89_03015 [Halieaceae bacterium]|nr:MAG: hypothetical protein DBW89_03015 [Halieaceae bacterium]
MRRKACSSCQSLSDVLYRCRGAPANTWEFRCEPCLVKMKEAAGTLYQYGGTWKAAKRRP